VLKPCCGYHCVLAILDVDLNPPQLHLAFRRDNVVARRQVEMNRSLPILIGCTCNQLSVNAVYLDWAAMDSRHIGVVEHIAFAVDIKFTLSR
jgi:hypothetical protein